MFFNNKTRWTNQLLKCFVLKHLLNLGKDALDGMARDPDNKMVPEQKQQSRQSQERTETSSNQELEENKSVSFTILLSAC